VTDNYLGLANPWTRAQYTADPHIYLHMKKKVLHLQSYIVFVSDNNKYLRKEMEQDNL